MKTNKRERVLLITVTVCAVFLVTLFFQDKLHYVTQFLPEKECAPGVEKLYVACGPGCSGVVCADEIKDRGPVFYKTDDFGG